MKINPELGDGHNAAYEVTTDRTMERVLGVYNESTEEWLSVNVGITSLLCTINSYDRPGEEPFECGLRSQATEIDGTFAVSCLKDFCQGREVCGTAPAALAVVKTESDVRRKYTNIVAKANQVRLALELDFDV